MQQFCYTISADDVPVAVFTLVTLESEHMTVTRALTSDVTLSYDVITHTAQLITVARYKQNRR